MKVMDLLCVLVGAGLLIGGGQRGNLDSTVPPVNAIPPAIFPPVSGLSTTVRIQNLTSAQIRVPVTFGQVFGKGDVPSTSSVIGTFNDGTVLPLQVDIKATHDDGSLRHAIISAILPQLSEGKTETINLVKVSTPAPTAIAGTPTALLSAGFTAGINITLDGQTYSASADKLLKSGKYSNWLAGTLVNEWQVAAPLKNGQGVEHPHLTARFAIRSYSGQNTARVDVTLENNWAYEPGPQNFTYDAQIQVGGKTVYSKPALTHYHHARWRKVFWWGTEPQIHIQHNTAYLIASNAVPNYDRSFTISEVTLKSMKTSWGGSKIEPMGAGAAVPYMPTTGGRPDIGLLPGWAVMYLLSMDRRAREITLGTADLAGSWSSHYRDKITDRPVSPLDYPYMTILGRVGDTYNPMTKTSEAFPVCAAGASCANVNSHDSSHQPAFAYLPYVLTGDYYYLEELQFWSMWNTFSSNPGYRENIKGLLKSEQVRGQAWSLRTLSEAAYITPDKDPLKTHFDYFLSNNLDWYNATYSNNPAANVLGILTNGYAVVYGNGTGVAPWQDDFFTSAVGHTAELGYSKAKTLLAWKIKFPIARMIGVGACWIDGASYSLKVRNSLTNPIYSSIGEAYRANHTDTFNSLACAGTEMASYLKLRAGEMTGNSSSSSGYPSNMQPALAYSADAGGADGANAWQVFMGRTVKPSYETGPQFAIIPR